LAADVTINRLAFADAIWRFRDNDQRMAIFTNGSDTESYLTTEGDSVPSIRKFLKDSVFDLVLLQEQFASYLSYAVVIESSAGTAFRQGEATSTTLNARVFSNGSEVTMDIAASRFRWRRVSAVNRPYPDDDATWNSVFVSGYRTLTVDFSSLFARATFFCDITDGL
jgi:hypothetical protein